MAPLCRYERHVANFADLVLNARTTIVHTPKGLLHVAEWGSLRHAAGTAGLLAHFSRALNSKGALSSNGIASEEIMAFAEHQVRAQCFTIPAGLIYLISENRSNKS